MYFAFIQETKLQLGREKGKERKKKNVFSSDKVSYVKVVHYQSFFSQSHQQKLANYF